MHPRHEGRRAERQDDLLARIAQLEAELRQARSARLIDANTALRDMLRYTPENVRAGMLRADAIGPMRDALFDEVAFGITEVGPDGVFQRVNRRFTEITGYTIEDLRGKTVVDITHPEDREVTRARARKLDQGELTVTSLEKRYLRKDGTPVWVMVTATRVIGPSGRYRIGIVEDVTKRRGAEERLRVQMDVTRAIAENAADALFLLDDRGHITFANPAAVRTFGYSLDELLGSALAETIAPPGADFVTERALRGREDVFRGKDGTPVDVICSSAPIADALGGVTGAVLVVHDISERKRIERELARRAAELERSNADLEQFAYVSSHDLQEPLRAMRAYARLVAGRYRDRLDPQADEYLGYIVDGAERMHRLIHDLLEYSRAGSGGIRRERCDLGRVLAEVLATLRPRIEETGAAVIHDTLPVLEADPAQLRQLFSNLLGNALKFEGERPPLVRVSSRRTAGGWEISVADRGIGIAPADAVRVFELFRRLRETDRFPGTGIGLAICKKIVERHGGRIWAERRPNGGTAFRFVLPD